jgi:predicted transcriptional regulator of viral defense system
MIISALFITRILLVHKVMTDTGTCQAFVNAVVAMARCPEQATRTFRRGLLLIHPDKSRAPVAQELTQLLTTIHTGIVDKTFSTEILTSLTKEGVVTRLAAGDTMLLETAVGDDTPSACGHVYRAKSTVDTVDPEEKVYRYARATNPEMFRRRVLLQIPRELRPRPPKEHPEYSRYCRLGNALYWVGTDEGRASVAHAIASVPDPTLRSSLLAAAEQMGFDP